LLAALTATITSQAIAAPKLSAKCDRVESELLCDVRSSEPQELEKFEVKRDGSADLEVLGFEPFDEKLRSAAYLFLIQRSGHPKDASAAVERLLSAQGKRIYRTFGLYSYADDIAEHVKAGSAESDIRKGLEKARKKEDKGSRTALFSAITGAVKYLDGVTADRKAIVLISDGLSKESVDEAAAIEAAKSHNVALYTIAMTGVSEGSENLNRLRRLAEATGGSWVDTKTDAGHPLPTDFATNFFNYLENGGFVKAKAGGVSEGSVLSVAAAVKGGSTQLRADGVTVNAGVAGGIVDTAKVILNKGVAWAKDHPLPTGAGGLAAVGLLLLGHNYWRNRRVALPVLGTPTPASQDEFVQTSKYANGSGATRSTASDTVILTPMNDRGTPEHVYAWLQFLDATSTRVPIGATNVRIGRHSDNDICLQNNSVHRQHAVLHMSHDKKFVIRDLGTANGVVVNSQKISQKELSDGDLIELGEVRARFFANPS